MSRTIAISTSVFAVIWAQRLPGEETEDAILSRLLKCDPQEAPHEAKEDSGAGLRDGRSGVHFTEGFEIQRTYKGKQYKATVAEGDWKRSDNGQRFPTINQLNRSIVEGNENVWNGNWKYLAQDGTARSIAELRQ
ncbi:hypothetical protein SAMN04488003_11150 [Loktanella fryxellensis]|uniref:Uncharacterized protein n=1 Tax=Loktanella fryxellensis TaxID=245187 RepID=A0A1H8EP81_9RHOB|nr:hypothetical protein [Loktanella fryxellensis]SEN21283.1 hypothetical protein SAMN04488003_11150 [Loktanella fryxellensis]